MPDQHVLVSNGPLRFKTPPAAPVTITGDGLLLEYLTPYPLLADQGAWPLLTLAIGMREITVERPIVYPIDTTASGTFGNDMPELFCTVIRALIPAERDRKGIEKEVYDSIHLILQWLRVLGRQYWLLQGPTGYGSYCRGSLFARLGQTLRQENFAVYDKTVLVKQLTASAWVSTQENISRQIPVPVSDSILCDALLSIAARDEVKALVGPWAGRRNRTDNVVNRNLTRQAK